MAINILLLQNYLYYIPTYSENMHFSKFCSDVISNLNYLLEFY